MAELTDKIGSSEINQKKGLLSRLVDNGKYLVVDSTGMVVQSTPVYAAFENIIVGMSDEVSMNARIIAGLMPYLGIGRVYGAGRDLWRRKFNITDKTKERTQQINDALYNAAFNAVVAPPIYLLSGSRNFKEIAFGTVVAMGVGIVNGGPMGYAVDLFRDLTGLQKSERVPNFIRKQNSKIKKGIAVALTAASIGLTAGIYKLTPNKTEQYNQPRIQQGVDNISYENKKLNCFNIRNCA